MTDKNAYREGVKQELGGLIESLELSDLQKRFLRSRWLDQVVWMEGKAEACQRLYYLLRLVAIIGGVVIPALVGIKFSDGIAAALIFWLTLIISLLVAVSLAVEQFFHYGERWRHYRRTVEALKVEAWQFFQLSGPYQSHPSHREAYPAFAAQVEKILQGEFEIYITQVMQEKKAEGKPAGPPQT
jgi:hypothetical protein